MDLQKLREAEAALATATTPEQINYARALLRTAIHRNRKQASHEHGTLAQSLHNALSISRKMKEGGASDAERHGYVEGVLREVWPKRRTAPWHYSCDDCSDTGLILMECTPEYRCDGVSSRTDGPNVKPGKYQRLCTKDPHYRHSYGMPCHCSRGDGFRVRYRNQSLDDAGTAPRKRMTRL